MHLSFRDEALARSLNADYVAQVKSLCKLQMLQILLLTSALSRAFDLSVA